MPDTRAAAPPCTASIECDITDRSSTLSRTFSAVKWILALTVVADHFFRPETIGVGNAAFDTGTFPAYGFICRLVESFLKNYAVPVFFFMSGYLAWHVGSLGYSSWIPRLRRRLAGLAVPFLIFSIFGFIMRYGDGFRQRATRLTALTHQALSGFQRHKKKRNLPRGEPRESFY